MEPEQRSLYSDWPRVQQPRALSSNSDRTKIFRPFTLSRRALEPTQPRVQYVTPAVPAGTKQPGRETDQSPPTSADVKKYVDLYILSPIRLYGVLHN
jgi:hypothetical protein